MLTENQKVDLANMWHTAKIPHPHDTDRHQRKLLTAKWFHDKYPEISEVRAYKELCRGLNHG